ncbi:aldolase catalytic domain-containing protein [Halomonas salipaludis]|nr:aldolase catalytic domain-containing protein [Halomonas salipaludis]
MKIIDCTLRDGGYYNDWDFDKVLVEKYLEAMADAKIDFVEIGFRFIDKETFYGAYAFATDKWLETLRVPDGVTLGVMCNAKDLLAGGNPRAQVMETFSPADESPVELVRIAAHFKEAEACEEAIYALHELGYKIGFNLMQAGGRSPDEITAKAVAMAEWPLEALYFADSLGNMWPEDVANTVKALRKGWSGEIGFHSHDNMGNGLANTLAAYEAGATWLDATVLGMGRGAGNVRLEYLLLELARKNIRESRLDSLLDLVVSDFLPMQERCKWGPNLFYHLSALYGVHPTYVQEMLSEGRYDHDQVIAALQRLGETKASGYSYSTLLEAVGGGEQHSVEGSWVAKDWLKDRNVLLIGPGESSRDHMEALIHYIDEHDPFVICLNSNPWFPSDRIDAWVACNTNRMLMDQDYYHQHTGQLITPAGAIPEKMRDSLKNWKLMDYGLKLDASRFVISETECVIPTPLTLLYAIALVNAAGASSVQACGLDGYKSHDPRHIEIEEALKLYHKSSPEPLQVISITPTNLSFKKKSVYAPEYN